MSQGLIDRLEIWGFEDDLALFKDGSVGFAYRVWPMDVSCQSDEKINQTKAALRIFLGSLPSNIDIQFVQAIEKQGVNELEEHLGFSTNALSVVRHISLNRFEKYRRLDEEGLLPKQENLVVVRVPRDQNLNRRMGVFALNTSDFEESSALDFQKVLRTARTYREEIERSLIATGLTIERVDSGLLVEKVFDTWNPQHPLGLGRYDESDIRDQMLLSELVKDIKGFRLGTTHHRMVSLKILPEQSYAGMASAFLALPFSSRLFLSIHSPDQAKEIEWLKMNRRMAYAMVVGKKGVSDLESEAKLQDIEGLLNEIVKNGEKIFSISLAIALRSENESELDSQVSQVLQVIRELSGAEGFMETYASFDIFAAASIPNSRNSERGKKVISSNLADLLPVFGLWSGFERPSVLLRTRMGSLFKFDPFSPLLTNANQIISGGSGSGKSYLTNLMIGQMLSQNPRVFVLDIGGSYQKTCQLLDGQYLSLSMSDGFSLNPFDLPYGEAFPSSEKIKFLVALTQIMTKEEDQKAIGRLEKSEIEKSVQEIYREQQRPRLSHLREKLCASDIPEVQRIGKILSLWCGDSPFGKFVDRETNIELSKRVVCFDLKGLEANPDLQSACLFIITDLVWREVQRDRTEMKFLVFDECWRLLENDAGAQFVGEVFRTFRKYYASAIAISQNIDDFARSKAAGAIMPNASIKWILKQPGADFARLSEVLRLNERETTLVQSLSQVKGQYSEAFLMCEDRHAVVSVESTPLEYWLATTDPKDFLALQNEKEATGKDGLQLLQHLAATYPTGSQAQRRTV